jgi:hypothetical protein
MAQLNISKPVGDVQADGSPSPSLFDDTLIVQYLLNNSPGPGRPDPPLAQDGAISPGMIAAIRAYESTRGAVDGRIDPGDATMVALNAIGLAGFEGLTDFLERRSVILRPNRRWNFTRGDFKTLVDFAGGELRFGPESGWLPDSLKSRFLKVFNILLDPAVDPARTWGVSPLDWYHSHLGLWSGVKHKPISMASKAWSARAIEVRGFILEKRRPLLRFGEIPQENVAAYRAVYQPFVSGSIVGHLLDDYATLPEARIVHHTFESRDWRPQMGSADPRRHWMVDPAGNLDAYPYGNSRDQDEAQNRSEFLSEGTIQINFLIDESGVIHPVLGDWIELSLVTGLPKSAQFL